MQGGVKHIASKASPIKFNAALPFLEDRYEHESINLKIETPKGQYN